MDAQTFLTNFEMIAEAPGGVDRLRELVLDLAISGRLVEQRPTEAPVSPALAEVRAEKGAVLNTKVKGRSKVPREPESWEVASETPTGWCWARIDDTGEYVNGLAFKQGDWHDDGLPIIRIQNLTNPNAEFNYARGSFPEDRTVNSGDILVSWSATLEAFVWDRGPAVVNQHIFKVIPERRVVAPEFLYHLLRHTIRDLADSDAAHGLAMKHINRGPFVSHVVGIPPLAEQERIVARVHELMRLCDDLDARQQARHHITTRLRASSLDALTNAERADDLRAAWSRVDANWEALADHHGSVPELRKAILQLAICGKLSAPGSNDEFPSVRVDAGQITTKRSTDIPPEPNAFPFELPAGWRWRRLQDLVDPERAISYGVIKLGPDPGPTNGVPVLRCSDVRFRRIDRRGIRFVEPALSAEYGRTVLRGGELLVNIRGTLGGCAVVPADMAGFNVAREVAVIPVAEVNPEYLLTVFSAPYFQSTVAAALRGTAYKGLNLGSLREFPIPVPPRFEQNRIETEVRGLMSRCDELEDALLRRREASRRIAAAVA
jgi:type I restriction enzyme S subunit